VEVPEFCGSLGNMRTAKIFTDGAAKGNPGPGGYGAVLLVGDTVVELGAGKSLTTNNEMELRAVVEALKCLSDDVSLAELYTDSKYVVEGATGWVFGWLKNGWKTKANTDVSHKELWQELVDLLRRVKVEWHKVPGHVGIIGNERADTIASDFGQGKAVTLYNGPRAEYEYEIENVAYDPEKAVDRSASRKRQGQQAYSYVSKVDGKIVVHQTWAECEARVKGQKGTRFKKALSADDEQAIIREFA
jgi:ribonuclease HI